MRIKANVIVSPVVLLLVLTAVLFSLASCGTRYVPRPYGYFRIALPEHAYEMQQLGGCPVEAEVSTAAQMQTQADPYWLDIRYPEWNARIHCSYKPVEHNLRELGDDAQEFVFKHAGMASSIPEQGYENPEKNVYGVLYELKGNTASPYQFYVTDSTHHFFRAALYFECMPNQDSLAPLVDFLNEDIRHMIETIQWK